MTDKESNTDYRTPNTDYHKTIKNKDLKNLYLDHFKPVFLIFDQFEELFIFGSKSEKEEFIKVVKGVVESDLQCRFLFVIREEYLAGITEFEKQISTILSNRVRIEKMTRVNAQQAIEGPCKYAGIEVEPGFPELLLEKLSPEGGDVELTYLQVFLDKIFKIAVSENPNQTPKFNLAQLQKTGDVKDLLGSFLEEQIAQVPEPDAALAVLKAFVSTKGTKRQCTDEEVNEYCKTIGKNIDYDTYKKQVLHFVNLRILRDKDESGRYELRHDALAAKIYEKITLVEKELMEVRQFIENAFDNYQRRKILLSASDLSYIAPYENKMYLSVPLSQFIEQSKREISRAKRRRRNIAIAAVVILLIIFAGFTWWAMRERTKANIEKIRASALYYNSLSKEILQLDPTKAICLAEYAYSIDTSNKEIYQNLLRIYYDHNFYNTLIKSNESIGLEDISPDGKCFLFSHETEVELRGLSGNLISILKGHSDNVNSAVFSKNSKMILTGSSDKTAILWDLKGNPLKVFKGHNDIITKGVFSPDQKYIVTRDKGNCLITWKISGEIKYVFHQFEFNNTRIYFGISPDSKTILTNSDGNDACLWSLEGKLIQKFVGHKNIIKSVAFSPDGTMVLTGSEDNTAILWDLSGKIIRILSDHKAPVYAEFSADGKYILTKSRDKTSKVWDISGKQICTYGDQVPGTIFSPDSKHILSGGGTTSMKLWDLKGNFLQEFKGHEGKISLALFTPDGKTLLSCASDNTIRKWDVFSTLIKEYDDVVESVNSIAFFPESENFLIWSNNDTSITIFDESGEKTGIIKGHNAIIISLAISRDGEKILVGYNDGTARLWDVSGNLLQLFKRNDGSVTSVAFSPDGKNVLTGAIDGTIYQWDTNGKCLQSYRGEGGTSILAFFPDGKSFLAISVGYRMQVLRQDKNKFYMGSTIWMYAGNGDICIWDTSGKLLSSKKIQNIKRLRITSSSVSPDLKYILIGTENKNAWLYDISGNLVKIFKGHNDIINSVAFSPDSRFILTSSDDCTARLWDLSGTQLNCFNVDGERIYSSVFLPKGRGIVTQSSDRRIKIWGIKMSLDEFQKHGDYEGLCAKDKIQYGLTDFSEIIKCSDNVILFEAAEYYLQKANESNNMAEAKNDLDYSLQLFDKLTTKKKDINYYSCYTDALLESYNLDSTQIEIERKIEETSNVLMTLANNKNEMLMIGHYFNFKDIKTNKELKFYNKAFELYKTLLNKYPQDTTLREEIAGNGLCNLSSYLIEIKEFQLSLNAIKLAYEADKNNPYVIEALPLCYLLNNESEKAMQLYLEWKDKSGPDEDYKSYKDAFLEDIEDCELKGITHPDFAKVKALLNDNHKSK